MDWREETKKLLKRGFSEMQKEADEYKKKHPEPLTPKNPAKEMLTKYYSARGYNYGVTYDADVEDYFNNKNKKKRIRKRRKLWIIRKS